MKKKKKECKKKRVYKSTKEKIQELKDKIEKLEINNIKSINNARDKVAREYIKELKEKATEAELKFAEIARKKHLNLEFQKRINIYDKNIITKFYIVDFCDVKNKLVFEIDGEYHNTEEQKLKDARRTRLITKEGYSVFRITNNEVFEGKITGFLYEAYLTKGIDITKSNCKTKK